MVLNVSQGGYMHGGAGISADADASASPEFLGGLAYICMLSSMAALVVCVQLTVFYWKYRGPFYAFTGTPCMRYPMESHRLELQPVVDKG
ncbi:hypothetical protein CYMTET_46460 [Cymbomonas tetramitiformis]|uniref:Uncharacterized protein n=1 Tax=Cymbomonas tetramitiformis TaxID=36881 RepID=A0AAE0EXK3_9CHLO|nr:hypothetical protein CYMTET_46460 [Cymbomonas tetramitiformis]